MDSIYMRRRRVREMGMGRKQGAARHGNGCRMFSLKMIVWPRAAETSTAAAAVAEAMELASSLVNAASCDRCRRDPCLQLNKQTERARLQISTAAAAEASPGRAHSNAAMRWRRFSLRRFHEVHLVEQLLQHLQHESTVWRFLRALLRQYRLDGGQPHRQLRWALR